MRFEVVVRAIIVIRDRILLQRNIRRDEYALSGGHIELGETSKQSLVRELREEGGIDIEVGKLAYMKENFSKHQGQSPRNGTVFFVRNDQRAFLESRENHIDSWVVCLEDLAKRDIQPEFLRTALSRDAERDFSGPARHIAERE